MEPVPVGTHERHPVARAVVASILLSPFAGYLALGRTRRAVVLAVAEFVYLAIALGAALDGIAWVMAAALLAVFGHAVFAVVDVGRLARSTPAPARRWRLAIPVTVALVAGGTAVRHNVRAHVIQSFQAPTGTMLPTLAIGDRYLVDKRGWEPRRGDIVLFRYPPPPAPEYSLRVKRVVAVAGDTVELREGHLVINGVGVPTRRLAKGVAAGRKDRVAPASDTDYRVAPAGGYDEWEEVLDGRTFHVFMIPGSSANSPPTFVPPHHVFVVGDNRDNNNDSRKYGPMQVPSVIGQAKLIWWSQAPDRGLRWNRFGLRL